MGTQAQIILAIANSLLGERRQAERLLNGAAVDLPRFERLQRLFDAAWELHRRWSGENNHASLITAFAGLYAARLGGFAKMLEQIPMAVAVRSLLLRAKKSDEFGSAQLLTMLDRYPEVSLVE